jgi:hypothetical protein
MTLKFQRTRTDGELLSDRVYAAMETGNPQQARLVMKEHEEAFPTEVQNIRHNVLKEYGIRI